MIEPRLFLCSGYQISEKDTLRKGRKVIELDSVGNDPNVNIRLEKLAKIFEQNFEPRLVDLIEIASYIYAADASTQRGTDWTDNNSTEAWERDFHFVIPVRDLTFWQNPDVTSLLLQIIAFISNDKVKIDFVELKKDRTVKEYLQFGELEDWKFYGVDRVTMFSGGLDSLAGITEQANLNNQLMLVSHVPIHKTHKRQKNLYNEIIKKFNTPIEHVPVFINKNKNLGREFLQRTRSLLFSAIGTVIAESIKADGVRFYENGIVSLNLPVADEVLRARASRTTHPLTLKLFSDFYSLVTERKFIVDNPYIFKTKKDIIEIIKLNNSADLIQHSCSCAHTYYQSGTQWHCGTCSQCIDRRVAIFAAKAQEFDPETDYVVDVFTGKRKDGYEKNMAVNFVRHATELNQMSDTEIATKFNRDISRAIRNFPNHSEATESFIKIHKEHGESVCKVLAQKISENSEKFILDELDKSSMLSSIANREHRESSWKTFAEKILSLLNTGIPKSCQTKKPDNEPHLQEICDGILLAHNETILVREFPFMRWSSGATKPDWSAEDLSLWIEAKYVRKKEDLGPIREAISSDITKYGDNGRRVLFFIYDPEHLITNESEFSNPLNNRETMMMHFLR